MNIPCPLGHLSSVTIVSNSCVMATNDPDDVYACHEKSCKYHNPATLEEWKVLLENQVPGGFGQNAPFYWEHPTSPPKNIPRLWKRKKHRSVEKSEVDAIVTNFCPKCGNKVDSGDSFCRGCGAQL